MTLVENSESKKESKEDNNYPDPPEPVNYFVSGLEYWQAKKKIVVMGTQPWVCEVSLSFPSKSFRS